MGRSLEQVARTIRWPPDETARLLAELERDGLACRDGSGWRLTDTAESRYGQALRNLGMWDHPSGARARWRQPVC